MTAMDKHYRYHVARSKKKAGCKHCTPKPWSGWQKEVHK
jgi:hypothetical protein